MPKRLIIVPAFNEAQAIARVVDDLLLTLPGYDVLVVNDGSTDDTADRVPPQARLVNLPYNMGIGGAMQTGYRYAADHGYDVAVQCDGDGQHPAEGVPVLVNALEASEGRVDLVVGSRFLEPGKYAQQASRLAGIKVLLALLRVLTGRRYTDCTSGFRAANRRVIEAFAQWYPDDYPEPEVILLLHRAGFGVEEVAVEMLPRTTGRTSIPLWRGVFYIIKVSVALLLDLLRQPWGSGGTANGETRMTT